MKQHPYSLVYSVLHIQHDQMEQRLADKLSGRHRRAGAGSRPGYSRPKLGEMVDRYNLSYLAFVIHLVSFDILCTPLLNA
jgi:hypothetical protein